MAKGAARDKTILVNAINKIATIEPPLPWHELERESRKLANLGPTMKVWGRLLALVRPDLYCTVSSPSVRANLAKALAMPQSSLERAEGYVALIKEIHSMPWFLAPPPKNASDAAMWRARAAFLDAIFSEGQGPE